MKGKNARVMGMTGTQIGILAGLSLVAVLSVCVLFWMFSSALTGYSQAETQPPAPVQPSATPTPAQAAPTAAAVTPTGTPPLVATSAPPAGWIRFQTPGAALWLPDTFVGGDMAQHRSGTIQIVTRLGKYFKNAATAMQTAPKEFVLWMVNKNAQQSMIISTATVQHLTSTSEKNIDQFVQDDLNSNANGTPAAMFIEINGTKKMMVLGHEARRITYLFHQAGTEEMGVTYFVKNSAEFWVIGYIVGPQEYIDMLPTFEQSMQTFYLGD